MESNSLVPQDSEEEESEKQMELTFTFIYLFIYYKLFVNIASVIITIMRQASVRTYND